MAHHSYARYTMTKYHNLLEVCSTRIATEIKCGRQVIFALLSKQKQIGK